LVQYVCNSFKLEILQGFHRPEHIYKIALFIRDADITVNSKSYNDFKKFEVVGIGYTAGGEILKNPKYELYGNIASLSFDKKVIWPESTITAKKALIYNDTLINKNSVAFMEFKKDFSSSYGNFIIEFPFINKEKGFITIQ